MTCDLGLGSNVMLPMTFLPIETYHSFTRRRIALKYVPLKTLHTYGALLIPDVTYGLQNYQNEILEKSPEEYLDFLRRLIAFCEASGLPAFADFYFSRLLPEEQTNILNQLSDDQLIRIQTLIAQPGLHCMG